MYLYYRGVVEEIGKRRFTVGAGIIHRGVMEERGRRRFTVGAGIGQAQGELQQGLDRIKERMIISGIANSNDHTDEMAFKAINDTAGISGIVPTLLVYGALPRLSEYGAPAPSVSQRSAALKKATAEI